MSELLQQKVKLMNTREASVVVGLVLIRAGLPKVGPRGEENEILEEYNINKFMLFYFL